MPKGSKKRQAAKKSKISKNSIPKTRENGGYLGDISNLPPNPDRRPSDVEDLKAGRRVCVEERRGKVKENDYRADSGLILDSTVNGVVVTEQFEEDCTDDEVGGGVEKVVIEDLLIGLSDEDEGRDCCEEAEVAKGWDESAVRDEPVIDKASDSCEAEDWGETEIPMSSEDLISPAEKLIDEGTNSCTGIIKPVEEYAINIHQVDNMKSDYSVEKFIEESSAHVETIVDEGGYSSAIEGSNNMKYELTVEEMFTPVNQVTDESGDFCKTEAYEVPEVDASSVVWVDCTESLVSEGRDFYRVEVCDDAEVGKHTNEIVGPIEQLVVKVRDCCETDSHEETEVENDIEEEQKDSFEILATEEKKVEKQPSAESFILVDQAVEEGIHSCEASVEAKVEISVEQTDNEGRTLDSREAETFQEMETINQVKESVIPVAQMAGEHMESSEAEGLGETEVEKPLDDFVALVEQVIDEARNSCEAKVCQEEKIVELSEEPVFTAKLVVKGGKDSFVTEYHAEMKVVESTEESMLTDGHVYAASEDEKPEDSLRQMASLGNSLNQSKELGFESVSSTEVGKPANQLSNPGETCDDKRKGDTSHVTKATSHAPLAVERATWWKFCGLLDLFTGSEK